LNSEVDANFTNLNDDKAELSGAAFTGPITTNSTVDGRDVATDGTKLDGIEASADVTDTTNVTAAGALMDSELTSEASVKALNQGVATTDSPTFAGLTTTANMSFGDNVKATFGSNDLQIYHDGSNSFISDTGTGNLFITGASNMYLQNGSSETFLDATTNGAVRLFYDNALKIETSSTGINVTGTATMDGLTVSGVQNSKVAYFDDSSEAGYRQLQFTSSNNGQYWDINSQGTSGGLGGVLTLSTRSIDRLSINTGGDISFYENTGTTPKFSWSSSNETIAIGTGASSTATISAYSRTVSANLPSALRIIENTGASTYWDIGANNGASPNLNFYVNANTTPKVTFASSGNVGIGTSPIAPLHVKGTTDGNLLVRAGSLAVGTLTGTALSSVNDAVSATTPLTFEGSEFNFVQSNAVKVKVDASGNVQLTSAAAVKLAWNRGGAYYNWIESDGVAGNNFMRFGVGNDEKMRIDSNGQLLLGTTENVFGGADRYGFNFYANGQSNQSIDGTSEAVAQYINRENDDGAFTEFYKDRAKVGSIGVEGGDLTIGTDTQTGLHFWNNTAIRPWNITANTRADASCDLGELNTRFKDLHLSGTANVGGVYNTGIYNQQSGDIQFWVPNVGEAVRIQQNTGNVGIGESNPSVPLAISATTGAITTTSSTGTNIVYNAMLNSGGGLYLGLESNTGGGIFSGSSAYDALLGHTGAYNMHFVTSNTIRATIDSSGKVGIGTSSPEQPITVGDTSDSQNYIQIKTSATGAAGLLFSDGASTNPAGYLYDHATNSMQFKVNGSEKMRILSTGGITFNGDTAQANALDDYEEGTWTPTVYGGTTAGSTPAGTFAGNYTKIGRQVTAMFSCSNVTLSGAAGSLYLGGLPFTAQNPNNREASGIVRMYNQDLAAPSDGYFIPLYNLVDNATAGTFLQTSDNAAWSTVSVDNSSTLYFEGTITYFT
jgi:hypothetical protein